MKLGIIGNGFVGNAIAHAFIPKMEVRIHDKDPEKNFNSLDEVVNGCDVVFVCVPTPMRQDSTIDLSIVESVFEDIKKVRTDDNDTVFVLKSTVVPGTTRQLSEKYPKLNIVFNPEFLTERHARFDFLNQSRIILGFPNDLGEDQKDSNLSKNYETLR